MGSYGRCAQDYVVCEREKLKYNVLVSALETDMKNRIANFAFGLGKQARYFV